MYKEYQKMTRRYNLVEKMAKNTSKQFTNSQLTCFKHSLLLEAKSK